MAEPPSGRGRPARPLWLQAGHEAPAPAGAVVAWWSRWDVPDGHHSLPRRVDGNALALRGEYLRWLHELANRPAGSGPLKGRLRFGDQPSYWWMGALADCSPLKTEVPYRVLTLRGLETLFRDERCDGLVVAGGSRALRRTLRDWMKAEGLPFRAAGRPAPARRRLPHVLEAAGHLTHRWWRRWRHLGRGERRQAARGGSGPAVAIYFPGYDREAMAEGRFRSIYCGPLQDALRADGLRLDWLWIFHDAGSPTFREALAMRDRCRRDDPAVGEIAFLDEFVGLRVLGRAAADYLRACLLGLRLRLPAEAFRLPGSRIGLMPVIRREWTGSFRGRALLDAAIYVHAMAAMADARRATPWLLYIWENQPWEAAMAWAARRRGIRTIGFQHSTVPPLYFSHFRDSGDRADRDPDGPVSPDLLAVNGEWPARLVREGHDTAAELVLVEALRTGAAPQPHAGAHPPDLLLVLLAFDRGETDQALALLRGAAQAGALSGFRRCLVRPHPMRPVPAGADRPLGGLIPEVTDMPLQRLATEAKAAVCAGNSSAHVDLLRLGVPTVGCPAEDAPNLSPLFGHPAGRFARSAAELAAFLADPGAAGDVRDLYCVDPALPRWRALLGTHESRPERARVV